MWFKMIAKGKGATLMAVKSWVTLEHTEKQPLMNRTNSVDYEPQLVGNLLNTCQQQVKVLSQVTQS